MKVLHTAAIYRKDCHGVSGVVRDLVEAIDAAGHECAVMAPVEKGAPRENGVMRVKMNAKGGIDAKTLTRARRLKPDLIHAHDPLALGPVARELAERLGVPLVYTMHGPGAVAGNASAEQAFREASGELMAAADLVVAPSADARRWAATRARRGTVQVIPTGITEAFLEAESSREGARESRSLAPHDFVVGLVGGVHTDGGLGAALEALVELMNQSPSIHLLVTGTQQFRRKVSRMLPAELRDRAVRGEKTGEAPRLQEWMDALDLLLAPNLTDPEGLSAQRAMARGIPVLAPHTAPWARLLTEGKNGFLAQQDTKVGFRSGLERARRGIRTSGEGLARAAKESVEGQSMVRTASLLIYAYESLLGARERPEQAPVREATPSVLAAL
jgi:glycosyltransferase involved in cell wall biosynthesis